MTCHDAREQFSALVDDALDLRERQALDAHLATCADCRRELQRFRDTVSLVRAAAPVRAPASFVDRVLQEARAEPWPQRLLRSLFLPWPIKLPMEAAAIVLVAVGVGVVYRGSPELQQSARQEPAMPPASHARGYASSEAEPSETTPRGAQLVATGPTDATGPETKAPVSNAPASPSEEPRRRVLRGEKDDKAREQDARSEPAKTGQTARRHEGLSDEEAAALKDKKSAEMSASARSAPPPAASGPQSVAAAPPPQAPTRDADAPKALEKRAPESQDRQAPIEGKRETPPTAAERQRSVVKEARSGAIEQTQQRADPTKAQPPARVREATASLSFAPPDVSGQLAVSNREMALRNLKELAARVGAVEAYRLDTADGPIIELAVRREMYAELNSGLARLGRWQPSKEPTSLPVTVRVVVRITG